MTSSSIHQTRLPGATATTPEASWRDAELMAAYRQGQARAFELLHQRYATRLLRYFMRRTRDAALATDLVQQTFLRLHAARESYDLTQAFDAWLFSIAGNLLKDEYKRRGRRPGDQRWDESGLSLVHDESRYLADDALLLAERRRRIERALDSLPASQRRVVVMHKLEGSSFGEIALALGQSVEAVKSRAFRGYRAMRATLELSVDERGRPLPPIHRGCARCPGVA